MQSTIDHVSAIKNQLRIIHKYEGSFYEYMIDEEGYAEIVPMLFTKRQREIGLADMVMDLDDIQMSDIDKTKIKLLHVLAKTNCGHCNTFLDDETFKDIEGIMTMWRWEKDK